MWEAQPWHRSSSHSRVSLTCSRAFPPPWLHPCPLQPLLRGWGWGSSWSLGSILISVLPPSLPFPGSFCLPRDRVRAFSMSLLFLTPTGQCSPCLHPRGRSLLFLRCPRLWVWDCPGCGWEAQRGFCSVCSGWDEGSGMLQQEFQLGFAPGGCVPSV